MDHGTPLSPGARSSSLQTARHDQRFEAAAPAAAAPRLIREASIAGHAQARPIGILQKQEPPRAGAA